MPLLVRAPPLKRYMYSHHSAAKSLVCRITIPHPQDGDENASLSHATDLRSHCSSPSFYFYFFFVRASFCRGEPSQCVNVLLLHDVAESGGSYCGLGRSLAGRGYGVFAPDLRGHGDSSWSTEGNYSPAALSDDLESLIVELDLYVRPLVLVGFGWGIGKASYCMSAVLVSTLKCKVTLIANSEHKQINLSCGAVKRCPLFFLHLLTCFPGSRERNNDDGERRKTVEKNLECNGVKWN